MNLLPRSIRWRIQFWHGALLLLVLTGFGLTAYRLQRAEAYRRLDGELGIRLNTLSTAVRPPPESRPPPWERGNREGQSGPRRSDMPPPPGGFRLPSEFDGLFASGGSEQFYYVIWSRTGEIFGKSENAPADAAMPARTNLDEIRSRNGFREAMRFTPPGECVCVGVSEAALSLEMSHFGGWLAVLGGVVLVLGLAGGAWLAARAIEPIQDISSAAARIADGHLNERIPVGETGGELDRLAVVLNDTFTRLDATFTEQARFTSDAAHELRTPVSIILAQSQLALARQRSDEEYRETIAMTQRAAQRMHGIIESLLALASLDASNGSLHRQPCDLATLAREELDLIRPLADERHIVLHHDLAPANCTGDPDRLAQVLSNLLTNAVKYSRPNDEVRLSTAQENGHAVIRIADTGPGIAAEHLPHLFDRFYRADASRNRNTGGAGLGLAICRSIAKAHGGTLEAASEVEKGSTFTLRIPIKEN